MFSKDFYKDSSVGGPTETCTNHLCADTECPLEELSSAIDW